MGRTVALVSPGRLRVNSEAAGHTLGMVDDTPVILEVDKTTLEYTRWPTDA